MRDEKHYFQASGFTGAGACGLGERVQGSGGSVEWILELPRGAWSLVSHDLPGHRGRSSVFQHETLEGGDSADRRVPALWKRDVDKFPRPGLCPWDQAPGPQLDSHSKAGRFSAGELEAVSDSLQS